MFDLPGRLRARSEPVSVGILGAGQFGTKCLNQLCQVPGLTCVGIADPNDERVAAARSEAGIPAADVETATDTDEANTVIDRGRIAVLDDGAALVRANLDVVLEATGEPVVGARHAYEALLSGTHVVMATCEADAVVGPLLGRLASVAGLCYTPAYGDQPALLAELVAWADTCGLDVVAGGRGISNYDANAAIELCVAANVTGLAPDIDGLHTPTVPFRDAANVFRPREAGGRLQETRVLDGIESPPDEQRAPGVSNADGVFVVVSTANDAATAFIRRKNRAGAYPSDDGEYLTFFRPHHLPGPETLVSIASVAVGDRDTGTPQDHVADVVAIADRDLDAGTQLEIDRTSATSAVRADLRRGSDSRASGYVPYGLLDGAQVTTAVEAGDIIEYTDVELERTFLHHLRAIQDAQRS